MWYRSVTIQYATHGIYVHTCYCFIPEANNSKVFNSGNYTNTTKRDLPEKYYSMLSEWGNNIYTAISNEKIFPKDCDTQKFIICNHYPSGYEAHYYLIRDNYPNNLTHPIDLMSVPPTQLKV